MEKKNIKIYLIPIISIAVFTLILFGAGYAYFAASSNVTNVTNIVANLPEYDGAVVTTSDTCSLTVNATDMLEGNANNNTPVATSTCHLNVTLNGTPGIPFVYGVILEETSTVPYTTNSANEFKYTLSTSETSAVGNTTFLFNPTNNKYTEYSTSNTLANVTFKALYDSNINGIDFTYNQGNLPSITNATYALHTSNSKVVPLAVAVIEIPTGQNTYTQTYTFTEDWYNLEDIDQSAHASKTYTYELKVVNLTEYVTSSNNSSNVGFTGTIYRNTGDDALIGDNISVLTSGYETNYSNISTDFYLKHTVENNIIRESYACIKYIENNTLKEACVKGADGGTSYGTYNGMSYVNISNVTGATGNIKALSDAQSYFDGSSGSCYYSSSASACVDGTSVGLRLYASEYGSVASNYDSSVGFCLVGDDASSGSSCYLTVPIPF